MTNVKIRYLLYFYVHLVHYNMTTIYYNIQYLTRTNNMRKIKDMVVHIMSIQL